MPEGEEGSGDMNITLATAVAIAAAHMQVLTVPVRVEECAAKWRCVNIAGFELKTRMHWPGDLALVNLRLTGRRVVGADLVPAVNVQVKWEDYVEPTTAVQK